MKNLSVWQRLNLAVALLCLFLFLGGLLATWLVLARDQHQRNSAELCHLREAVAFELMQQSEIIRGALLDASLDSSKVIQRENRFREVRNQWDDEPSKAALWGPYSEVGQALKDMDRFEREEFFRFGDEVFARLKTNPAAASAYYASNFPGLEQKQNELLGRLARQGDEAAKLETSSARTILLLGLTGIVITLIAALVVARVHSRSMTAPMQALVEAMEPMRRGDFTRRLAIEREDEFGQMGTGLNKLAEELSELVGQVQRSGIQVNSTAIEIAATAREQQTTANEIAATTAEIGATSREISVTSKELVKTMNEVSHVSEETANLAGAGQNAIGRMEDTMRQIMEASGSITAKLAVLSEKTANINTVVTTITKVADQTNLLSLNAAIEAEKAGEYGLGFAVVAMEIRRLADQTAVSTYDIEKMVKEMQSAVSAGVMGMDKFSEEVRHGVGEVRQVGTQLAQIIHQVQTLTPRFHTVNEGMHAQATGAEQISETLTHLNEAAQLTAESLRQSNASIEQLNEAAGGLQTAVARFKLKG